MAKLSIDRFQELVSKKFMLKGKLVELETELRQGQPVEWLVRDYIDVVVAGIASLESINRLLAQWDAEKKRADALAAELATLKAEREG